MECSPDEITLPRIVRHGTTEQYIDRYTRGNGTYEPPHFEGIWATTGDVRSWPRHCQPGWKKATLVIDVWRTRIAKVTTGAVYFHFLPPGSYRVLRESECSFAHENTKYSARLDELTDELVRQPF